RRNGIAIIESNVPAVQRARDFAPEYDALRQWAAFVRALVRKSKYFIIRGAKDRDVAKHAFNHPRTESWNLVEPTNVLPARWRGLHPGGSPSPVGLHS